MDGMEALNVVKAVRSNLTDGQTAMEVCGNKFWWSYAWEMANCCTP